MKKRKKIYKKQIMKGNVTRVTLFGMLFLLVITAYYRANFSLSKEVKGDIKVTFEDYEKLVKDESSKIEIMQNLDGAYYISLPAEVNGKQVLFYEKKIEKSKKKRKGREYRRFRRYIK